MWDVSVGGSAVAGESSQSTVKKDLDTEVLRLQPEEVQAVKWASLEEILQMIEAGVFIPYHKELIRLLFYMRNHRGTFLK